LGKGGRSLFTFGKQQWLIPSNMYIHNGATPTRPLTIQQAP